MVADELVFGVKAMKKPLLVFEDIQSAPKRRIFTLIGTEIFATPLAWLSVPAFFIPGFGIGLILRPESSTEVSFLFAFASGFLLCLTNSIHSLGHILAGKMVRAPLDAVLITATRPVNMHKTDPFLFSRFQRIVRAAGGPALNIAAGFIALLLSQWFDSKLAFLAAYFNLAIGLWLLFPIPSLDGWVLWGELLRFRKHPGDK
jgi:Zn-dependent protease